MAINHSQQRKQSLKEFGETIINQLIEKLLTEPTAKDLEEVTPMLGLILAASQSPLSAFADHNKALCVSVPCTFPFYKYMLLYPFLFPLGRLPGMSLPSHNAQLRFPIGDLYEDRSSLLHFKQLKSLWHPGITAETDDSDTKTESYIPLSVCVHMGVHI